MKANGGGGELTHPGSPVSHPVCVWQPSRADPVEPPSTRGELAGPPSPRAHSMRPLGAGTGVGSSCGAAQCLPVSHPAAAAADSPGMLNTSRPLRDGGVRQFEHRDCEVLPMARPPPHHYRAGMLLTRVVSAIGGGRPAHLYRQCE